VRIEVDKWAHLRNVTPEYEIRTFYAEVNYFLVYEFMGKMKMLANVVWTNPVTEDAFGTISFIGFGATQFIDVSAIDRCVGFMQLGRTIFIVDKEGMEDWDDNEPIVEIE